MKSTSPVLHNAYETPYKIVSSDVLALTTLTEAAELFSVSTQRLSRILRALQIPVHQLGITILLNPTSLDLACQALKEDTLKRGRKTTDS